MKYFAGQRFDEDRHTLSLGTKEVRLTRKAAAVLECLIERAGRTVTREEILSTVWSGTHVHADNVKVLVHELRSALDDDPRDPHFIRSEPGGGYTFVAPLRGELLGGAAANGSTAPVISADPHVVFNLAFALADSRSSDPRVFLVDGERGMGKSALCVEFMQRARQLGSARVCYGQSAAHAGASEPYLPVLDALHHLARQLPTVVPALLAQHAPTWLARMPSWVIDAAPQKNGARQPELSRMIGEFVQLLESFGPMGTTVIVLDDLQWADLETVELLRAIAQRHGPLRTIVLGAYTPFATTLPAAALRTLTGELRASSRSAAMSLTPLSDDHVRRYLISRFSTPPVAALAPMIRRVSSGNPLLMVSMTDALVAAGLIVLGSDGWCLRHSPRTIERSLPASIVETLLWRLDQLDAQDRVVLECAAAVGLDFCALDVAKAAGVESPVSILRRMEILCERGFIARRTRKGQRRTSPGDVYRFIHPLHAHILTAHAPVFDQLRAAERLASASAEGRRFG